MPERVTKEERIVSLVIAKAREMKELLHLSLNDNNRSPKEDKSEVFKLKRPKAQKDTTKFSENKGPANEHGFAGDMTTFKKGIVIIKSILKEYDEMLDNPVLNRERAEMAAAAVADTRKDLDRLEMRLKTGQMNQDDYEKRFGIMIRRLTSLQQKVGPFPPKQAQPLLPSQNQRR
tara:strand:+ start:7811 stop:8335 length:525 start_codon:yes stop_codon:yes gene_type:complete